eukprot:m.59988 g.59988  ORF g.59988 m.59988 type:complete len:52 (-) comp9487_c0_seq2:1464-1619(-)
MGTASVCANIICSSCRYEKRVFKCVENSWTDVDVDGEEEEEEGGGASAAAT